jgi:EAL domain-containing protein (putative c-di-GMP-specific phosphodiesterase class I)
LNDQFTYLAVHFYRVALKFYRPQCGEIQWQARIIESQILDSLKSRYGFVPKLLYERRFQLFQAGLEETTIHFEPIFDLEKMSIHGWEALARDPVTQKAPVDLFDAAELWGLEFTVTLDTTLLYKAVQSFEKYLRLYQYELDLVSVPLFVNVYPESLMSPVYFDQVKQIMNRQKKLLKSHHLTLEISEKKQLPFAADDPYHPISLETFKDRLMIYTEELGIQFGIDDFGVGYSSVHRFTGLNLPYVKIDREILHQKPFDAVIRFVKEVIDFANPYAQSQIIVEGIDHASPIGLDQLKALGIRFVQGHLIGRATADPDISAVTKSLTVPDSSLPPIHPTL